MDALTFIAEIIKAITWPAAVIVIVVFLRGPLSDLLRLLRKLKYKDLEMEFEREVGELSQAAKVALPQASPAISGKDQQEKLIELAITSPNTAIVQAWRQVENEIVELAHHYHLTVAPAVWTMPLLLTAFLLSDDRITESEYSIIHRLKGLRDRVTQTADFEVSGEEALKYVEVAARLVASLKAKTKGDTAEPDVAPDKGR